MLDPAYFLQALQRTLAFKNRQNHVNTFECSGKESSGQNVGKGTGWQSDYFDANVFIVESLQNILVEVVKHFSTIQESEFSADTEVYIMVSNILRFCIISYSPGRISAPKGTRHRTKGVCALGVHPNVVCRILIECELDLFVRILPKEGSLQRILA